MVYFNGFSLKNEEVLFDEILNESDFLVAGFSYGAIKAFEYALDSKERIDKLVLISPAFFQNRDRKFKKLQLISFKKNQTSYIDSFLASCSNPSDFDLKPYLETGTYEQLNELLEYTWKIERVKELLDKNIKLEIYLGESDKIVNTDEVLEFFKDLTKIYYIKNVGHILK